MKVDTSLYTLIYDTHSDFNSRKIEVTSMTKSGGEPGLRFVVLKEDRALGHAVTLREDEIIWTITRNGDGGYIIKSNDGRKLEVNDSTGRLLWLYFHGMASDVVVGFGASHAIKMFFELAEFQNGPSDWLLEHFPAWSQDYHQKLVRERETQVSKVMDA